MRVRSWIAGVLIGAVLLGCQPGGQPAGGSAAQPAAPAQAPSAAQSAPAPAAPPAPVKLDVAYVAPSEAMAIPWIAKEAGLFTKYGLDVNLHLVPGTPRLVQSLVAGDFDFGQVGSIAVMRARVENADTLMLASSGDYSTFKIMAHPQTGIRTLADLRGRTVGVSQIGSESHTFLKLALARQGVAIDDVNILQAGGNPQAAQAMLTGNIDASAVSGVMVPASERAGAVLLADGRELKIPSPRGSLASTRKRVERDRDMTMRFMRAYVEGVHYYKTQRDETIKIMQQYMSGLALDEVAYLWEEGDDGYKPLPTPSDEAVQAVIDREFEGGQWKPSDFADLSYLREIERSGLVTQLWGR
jgi:ABC-type nitrate/sulfonate/bicarbonate transport system substrate-binding protein